MTTTDRKMKNIKDWYQSEFLTDEVGAEISPNATFEELKNNLTGVYDYLGVWDAIVRERVFSELANRLNVHCDVVYDAWIKETNQHE